MSTKFWKFFKFIFPTLYTYYKTTNLKIFNFNLIVYRIFFRCYTYNINRKGVMLNESWERDKNEKGTK